MPFHIQPLREFLVRPALPASLSRLGELAYNLLWGWELAVRSVFRRLDPVLWRECGYNPILMLGRVPQATLERAASDPRFVALYRTACETYDARVRKTLHSPDGKLVAYFSAEYGLTECLPVYSGGLGILSGDHLKSSSDLGLPLVAVGLLYSQGYFHQYLTRDGWQQEKNVIYDFHVSPISLVKNDDGALIVLELGMPNGPLKFRIWKAQIG